MQGFNNVNAAVSDIQHGKCLLCGKPINQYHHIIPKSKGGSNTLKNLAGLQVDLEEQLSDHIYLCSQEGVSLLK